MKRVQIIYIISLVLLIDVISAGFLECSENSDCIDPSKCENNICECPVGFGFNSEGSACLPVLTGMQTECEEDQQCGWLLGKYRCYENKCDCEKGWRYYQGRCTRSVGLNELCSADQDCFNGYDILAMICKNKICGCNEGYYLRAGYDCRPISTVSETDNFCSLNSDCKTENSACVASKCVIETESDNPMVDLPEQDSIIIASRKTEYAIDCETNDECSSKLPNSICYSLTKKCVCKRGYVLADSSRCVEELGTDVGCKEDTDCEITPGRCIDGKCYCRKTYFTAKGNNACQKPITHDNLFCNTDARCHVYGTAVTCIANKCYCQVSAELDDNYVCRTTEDGCDVGCDNDKDCTSILNSVCTEARVCECPNDYRLESKTCLPNLGARCDSTTKLCTLENTVCGTSGTCTCIEDYVASENSDCVKVSTGLNGTCEFNIQCSTATKNSECVKDICTCSDDYIAMKEICRQKKFMGDVCTDVTQCHVMLDKHVLCRNGICQCSADMQSTTNGLDCTSSASSLLLQASTVLLSAICYLSLKLST